MRLRQPAAFAAPPVVDTLPVTPSKGEEEGKRP
jgi:hypothetical protein